MTIGTRHGWEMIRFSHSPHTTLPVPAAPRIRWPCRRCFHFCRTWSAGGTNERRWRGPPGTGGAAVARQGHDRPGWISIHIDGLMLPAHGERMGPVHIERETQNRVVRVSSDVNALVADAGTVMATVVDQRLKVQELPEQQPDLWRQVDDHPGHETRNGHDHPACNIPGLRCALPEVRTTDQSAGDPCYGPAVRMGTV